MEKKGASIHEVRRDIIHYALQKANNGDWFYKPTEIVNIIRNIYKGNDIYADGTIKNIVSEARNKN